MFMWNTATSTLPGGPFLNHFLLKNAQRLSEGHSLRMLELVRGQLGVY